MFANNKQSKKKFFVNVTISLESDSCLQRVSTKKKKLLLMLLFFWKVIHACKR